MMPYDVGTAEERSNIRGGNTVVEWVRPDFY